MDAIDALEQRPYPVGSHRDSLFDILYWLVHFFSLSSALRILTESSGISLDEPGDYPPQTNTPVPLLEGVFILLKGLSDFIQNPMNRVKWGFSGTNLH